MKSKRKAGILLNVSSFPGKYGIGGFSCNAEAFLSEFAGMGFKIWQTLPITSLGWGNSPYCGISAYAGNFLYIDLERLPEGLLTKEEICSAECKDAFYLTDYNAARSNKGRLLRVAYSRLTPELTDKVEGFAKENADWLNDYAAFMVLKGVHDQAAWTTWEDQWKKHTPGTAAKVKVFYPKEFGYYLFEQYLFFTQWARIKKYAADVGIEVFGDVPVYVSHDSVDVWADPKAFLLDKDYKPTEVAGVPPDYFSADGQLWGNPLYDYAAMKKDNYAWWTRRIKHLHRLYDIIRIDHFRGFANYWAVPADAKTAKEGKWKKGPGKELFDVLYKEIPDLKIIAEDLGIIDDDVRQLLKDTGIPGMRVIQFGFDGDKTNIHLPYNYPHECVAYTATHDNDTTLGWLLSLDSATQQEALSFVGCAPEYGWASGASKCPATRAFIRDVMASCADIAIVPMQDLCGYGSDTRMNTPGQPDGCWRYRTNYNALGDLDHTFIRTVITRYGR